MKMKQKTKSIFKTGILFLGIVILLWNCQNQIAVDEISISQNTLTIPTIENSKANFENINNGNHIFLEYSKAKSKSSLTSKKSSSDLELNVDWEASTVKPFDENVNILYTPVQTNTTNRMKTFLASVNNDGEIETYSLTLFYDKNSNQNQFSGLIFKYSIEGNFIEAYKYINGIKTENYIPKENLQAKGVAAKSGCDCILAVADMIWLANTCGSCVENMLDCVCISGGGSGSSSSFDISQNNWNNPNNNLTNNSNFDNDYTSGGGLNSGGATSNNDSAGGNKFNDALTAWWAEDEDIIDNTDNPCVTKIINSLKQKSNYKSLVPNLEGTALINNGGTTHLSQMVLDLFDHSKKYNLTFNIKQLNNLGSGVNGNTSGFNIDLDTDLVKDATELFIAKTIIHESFHAFINHTVRENSGSIMANILNKYYDYYKIKYPTKAGNLTHHQFISQYVESLAHSLSLYDNNQQDISFYTALSWGGLESSTAYQALPNKIEIQRIITNERLANRNAKSDKCPS